MIRAQCILIAICSLSGILQPVVAAENSRDPHKAGVFIGSFITDRDSKTRLDSDSMGMGSDIDLSDDLGIDKSETVFRLNAYLWTGQRHRFDASFFRFSGNSTIPIARDLQFGEEFFSVNTEITSDLDVNIYKLAYSYSVLDKPSGFLGLSAGLHAMDFKTSLSATSAAQVESRDITAPLPVVGIRGEKGLTDKWLVRASAEIFAIEFDDVDGKLVDAYAAIEYRFTDTLSAGLAYNTTNLDVDAARNDFAGSIDWGYDGFLLYVGAGFGSR